MSLSRAARIAIAALLSASATFFWINYANQSNKHEFPQYDFSGTHNGEQVSFIEYRDGTNILNVLTSDGKDSVQYIDNDDDLRLEKVVLRFDNGSNDPQNNITQITYTDNPQMHAFMQAAQKSFTSYLSEIQHYKEQKVINAMNQR